MTIPAYSHNIGEQILFYTETANTLNVRVIRVSDGLFFNFLTTDFENESIPNALDYIVISTPVMGVPALQQVVINSLPVDTGEFILEIDDGGVISYQSHRFGGAVNTTIPNLVQVYGTVINPSGQPLSGALVKVQLANNGYYLYQGGVTGFEVTTSTDASGYFSLDLVAGADVVISIPSIGFTTRGIVPSVGSLEISSAAFFC